MTAPRQQTIAEKTVVEGTGLHTGEQARIRFLPAPPGHGLRFHRIDTEHEVEIPADLEHISSTDRGTSLAANGTSVHTVEHLLAAAAALELDNLRIEVDGPEVPILDGSFGPFFELLDAAGSVAQNERARVLDIVHTVSIDEEGGASYAAVPESVLRVSATIEFDHPLVRRQFASFNVGPEQFGAELARARTFGFLSEAEALRKRGLARGATLENALVLDEDGLAAGELRYPDEFVRHKIGDVIGDLALLGRRIRGHVVAERPSHAGNLELARALLRRADEERSEPAVDIHQIMRYLPHRYPMLLVDRIIEFDARERIVGLKNVTINEPFFQGHYPDHPIMPGVLVIEAMAQVGGLLLMDAFENPDDKVVYFLSMDNVKWRRPVRPGDQLYYELEMVKFRGRTCRMKGVGTVEGQVAAEAEMMARVVDR